ncbi:MAG TPA: hypothetical protein VHZ09_02235 [Acidobacteriaceae bacterium]|jgi:hypothetical protein|nr:hypothetical protein [Acidobacteriaceae bacterium]
MPLDSILKRFWGGDEDDLRDEERTGEKAMSLGMMAGMGLGAAVVVIAIAITLINKFAS